MSILQAVSADWLALRGPADAAARSAALATAAAGLVAPGPVVVHDLGSGTGAMLRWLAPRLRGPQSWVLHDRDGVILAQRPRTRVTDASGRAVSTTTSVEPLAELAAAALRGASLVTASALLDVITLDEAAAIVVACQYAGAPALFALTVNGAVALEPADPLDEALQRAFNDHQRGAGSRRRLLGPDAVEIVDALFTAIGWEARVVPTPWRLGAEASELIAAWLAGWVGAAIEQQPELAGPADAYLRTRHAQLAAGALRVEIGHEDLIAWPA